MMKKVILYVNVNEKECKNRKVRGIGITTSDIDANGFYLTKINEG